MREFKIMFICGFSGAYKTIDQFLSPQNKFNEILLLLETTTINWVFYNKCINACKSSWLRKPCKPESGSDSLDCGDTWWSGIESILRKTLLSPVFQWLLFHAVFWRYGYLKYLFSSWSLFNSYCHCSVKMYLCLDLTITNYGWVFLNV